MGRLVTAAALACLSGCGGAAPADPVDWWHGLEGGTISESRPPPPSADAPYPALSRVPQTAPVRDAAAEALVARGLIADRADAQYAAAVAPLAAPAPHPARGPASPPAPAAAAGSADLPAAALAAATAPPLPSPPPPSPPLAAPARPAPLSAPISAPISAPAAANPPPAEAALPDMPAAPPPPPSLGGVALPAGPPVPALTAPPPLPSATATAPLSIFVGFPPGQAALPEAQRLSLTRWAAQHDSATIVVTGQGEATSSDPAALATALPLAVARARAIRLALLASGVPPAAVLMDADAQGGGATARLVR